MPKPDSQIPLIFPFPSLLSPSCDVSPALWQCGISAYMAKKKIAPLSIAKNVKFNFILDSCQCYCIFTSLQPTSTKYSNIKSPFIPPFNSTSSPQHLFKKVGENILNTQRFSISFFNPLEEKKSCHIKLENRVIEEKRDNKNPIYILKTCRTRTLSDPSNPST